MVGAQVGRSADRAARVAGGSLSVTSLLLGRTWRWWAYRWPLAALLVLTGLLYGTLAFALNGHLRTYGFDLGIYYEALRGYAHFGLPLVALKGVHYDLLGDHFEPMLAVLVPTYWLWPSPDVLLLDQVLLLALSLIPVWMFAERRFGSEPGARRLTTTCLVAAYALAWELQALVGYDFHSLAFSVPILAMAIERADAGRWPGATIWVLSLVLVREDLALIVVAFGIYAAIRGRRLLGVALALVGATMFGVLTDLVVPALAGGTYPHWSYQELGSGPGPALRYVVTHPLTTLRLMVTPRTKLGLMAWTLLPGGLLALASPVAILAIPALLERLLSQRPEVWQTKFQYSAPLAPIVGMAVIDGLWRAARLYDGRWRRTKAGRHSTLLRDEAQPEAEGPASPTQSAGTARAALALLAVAVVVTSHFPLSVVVSANFEIFAADRSARALNATLRDIPRHVTVAAGNNLVPPLLTRDNPILITPDSVCGSWALVETDVAVLPYASVSELAHQLVELQEQGWAVIYERADIELLHYEGHSGRGRTCRRSDPLLAPE